MAFCSCLCLLLSLGLGCPQGWKILARAIGDFNDATIAERSQHPPFVNLHPPFHHHHHQTEHLLSIHSTAAICTAPPERACDRVSGEFACRCDANVIAAWEWRWQPLNEGSGLTRFVVTLRARASGWSLFLSAMEKKKKKSNAITHTHTQSCAHTRRSRSPSNKLHTCHIPVSSFTALLKDRGMFSIKRYVAMEGAAQGQKVGETVKWGEVLRCY